MAIGACSRLDPQPKFLPPTMMSPGFILLRKSGSASSMQCCASSVGSLVFMYRAGMIASVFTSSPNLCTLPFMECSFMWHTRLLLCEVAMLLRYEARARVWLQSL